MENLVVVFDREAVDGGEYFGEVLFLAVYGGGKLFDHVGELEVGEWSVVDDGAIGCEEHVSGCDRYNVNIAHQSKNERCRLRRRGRSHGGRGSCP